MIGFFISIVAWMVLFPTLALFLASVATLLWEKTTQSGKRTHRIWAARNPGKMISYRIRQRAVAPVLCIAYLITYYSWN